MTRLLLFILALLLASPGHAQQIVNPRIKGSSFVIGPYPIALSEKGVSTTLYSSLFFKTLAEGRGNTSYKLFLTVATQLTDVGPAVKRFAEATYSQDNCGRLNSADNWVFAIKNPKVVVTDPHNLSIKSKVNVSTWTCVEGVPETVCDHYSAAGIQVPYNCKLRPTRYKTINFEQGFEIEQGLFVEAANNKYAYKFYQMVVTPDNNTVIQNLINGILRDKAKTDEAMNNNRALAPTTGDLPIPPDFIAFNPKLENAWFETLSGEPFFCVEFSVGVTQSQIDEFMTKYFGSLYHPAGPAAPPPAAGPLTKARVRAECADYLAQHPGDTVQHCAALSGLPYDELPD